MLVSAYVGQGSSIEFVPNRPLIVLVSAYVNQGSSIEFAGS